MRDRTELTPIPAKQATELGRPKASIDVGTLPLAECQALILKLREELYFKSCELDSALSECEQAVRKSIAFQRIAEEVGHSLVSVSEYARASATEARRRGSNNEGGGTI